MFKNALNSVACVEFVNKIDSLANELLFSQNGFIYLKSKNAFISRQFFIDKFLYEANKLKNELNFSDSNNYIATVKKRFEVILNKHCSSQFYIWAYDVFDEFVENSLFSLSLNKKNVDFIRLKLSNALDWFASVVKLNDDKKTIIKKQIENKLSSTLNSSDMDYYPKQIEDITNPNDFIKIWELICDDISNVANIDLLSDEFKLSQDDVKYFQNFQNKLNGHKRTSLCDEIMLINTAIEYLKIADNADKYEFIKSLNNDFINHLEANKILNEEDKIKLVKRRISLFSDKKSDTSNYYKKLISSLNE